MWRVRCSAPGASWNATPTTRCRRCRARLQRAGHLQHEQRVAAAAPRHHRRRPPATRACRTRPRAPRHLVLAERAELELLDVGPFGQAGQQLGGVAVEVPPGGASAAHERDVAPGDAAQRHPEQRERLVVEQVHVVDDDATPGPCSPASISVRANASQIWANESRADSSAAGVADERPHRVGARLRTPDPSPRRGRARPTGRRTAPAPRARWPAPRPRDGPWPGRGRRPRRAGASCRCPGSPRTIERGRARRSTTGRGSDRRAPPRRADRRTDVLGCELRGPAPTAISSDLPFDGLGSLGVEES